MKLTKTPVAAFIALAISGNATAALDVADPIDFDADGQNTYTITLPPPINTVTGFSNTSQTIGAFDWNFGSTIGEDALTGASEFQVYSHAVLNGLADTGGDPLTDPLGMNSAWEITFVAGFGESFTSVTRTTTTVVDAAHVLTVAEADAINTSQGAGTVTAGDLISTYEVTRDATFGDATGTFDNFYRIYWDDLTDGSGLKSNALAGTGFNDGDLILSGTVSSVSGNFGQTSIEEYIDVNGDGDFTFGTDIVLATGWTLLDSNASGDQWGGLETVPGEGSTQITVDVVTQDTDFFITALSSYIQNLFFNTSTVLPFLQSDPSRLFTDAADANVASTVGTTNGISGPDILFQSDPNTSFNVERRVPEPPVIALSGLGFLLMGGLMQSFTKRRKG